MRLHSDTTYDELRSQRASTGPDHAGLFGAFAKQAQAGIGRILGSINQPQKLKAVILSEIVSFVAQRHAGNSAEVRDVIDQLKAQSQKIFLELNRISVKNLTPEKMDSLTAAYLEYKVILRETRLVVLSRKANVEEKRI